jgi:hypothetical protein
VGSEISLDAFEQIHWDASIEIVHAHILHHYPKSVNDLVDKIPLSSYDARMEEHQVLRKARQLIQESKLTYQVVGEKMGHPKESARQSVWNFLNGKNPSVATLKRFANALGIDVKELL